ncbi:MAG TPA: hypothetical protein VMS17_25210 [Gemmataceae bacterium]|nr:hypothetical protein [Gemmataceae bacterium]
MQLTWNDQSRLFAVEYKSKSTPAEVQAASDQVRRLSRPPLWPMVLVPYLPEERLDQLEREGVSGLDLCGNGVVAVPGEWLVRRAGKPNLYRQSFPIKNIFRGTSSLVARVFLIQPTYGAVSEIREKVEELGTAVTLSTASKVLARLEEELIVGRQTGEIRLLQPEKLLQRLVENYRPPEVTQRFVGKTITNGGPEVLLMEPRPDWLPEDRVSRVLTGASSIRRLYAELPREPMLSFYCRDLAALVGRLQRDGDVREQERFPDLELLETNDDTVYFGRCVVGGVPYASTVQTYVELATGGKREQEMAEKVKTLILHTLKQPIPGLRL